MSAGMGVINRALFILFQVTKMILVLVLILDNDNIRGSQMFITDNHTTPH